MPSSELPNLHDAILLSVTVDWEHGAASLRATLVGGERDQEEVEILASGRRNFSLRRNEPWGPSVFINGARLSTADGLTVLRVEMQSGDVIVMQADSIQSS